MTQKSEIVRIGLRILIVLLLIVATILLFQSKMYYTGFFMVLFLFATIGELVYFIYQYFNQVNKVLLSLLYEDYSIDLKRVPYHVTLNNAIDLYAKIKRKNAEDVPVKLIYNQILNSLESGVVIFKLDDGNKEIIFMNDFFCQYLGIPSTKKWSILEERIPQFCHFLEERNFGDYKTSLDIQVDNKERHTFAVQASNSLIQGKNYYIVLMDSIQRLMESKENEAWSTIMKVISHELMNSLTPIHSLTQNMKEIFKQEVLSEEDKEDLVLSLDTVINRSSHLQDFVDRYRKLTMLPTPIFANVILNDVILAVLKNYQIVFKDKSIAIKTDFRDIIEMTIDQSQLEQVLINLLTNSIHAIDDLDVKEIQLSLFKEGKRVFIEISDSGPLIDKSILSKIFLPFYTTRKTGAGIGLALSKSIIEAHNGYLYYQEREGRNTFVISLLI